MGLILYLTFRALLGLETTYRSRNKKEQVEVGPEEKQQCLAWQLLQEIPL